jgi:hypothetical protein
MLRLANLGMKRYDMHRRNARGEGAHDEGHAHIMHTHTHVVKRTKKNSANKLGGEGQPSVSKFTVFIYSIHIVHIQIM